MVSSVQYVCSSDGTNLAYTTLGEGEPAFVVVPVTPWSYFQREWHVPERRAMYESIAGRHRLVLYDSRGCGLSDRSSRDFSLETQIADLESVVDGLGLENFILMGAYQTSMTAIEFAAKHPDRISRFVLWSAYANAPKAFARANEFRTMRALREAAADWTLYTETLSRVAVGWQADDYAARNAAFLRDACSPEVAWAALDAMSTTDVSDRLPQITAPTLVIHRSGVPWPVLDDAREIVGQIPNARLAVIEGSAWPVDESDPALSIIAEFLGDEPWNRVEPPATVVAEGMSAILFADIVDSTALTERMGTRRSVSGRERWTRRYAGSCASTPAGRWRDACSATGSSRSLAPHAAVSRRRSVAATPGMRWDCRCTSACTPATSSTRRATSSAGP
jgi:pimeloyl-ACP methyl ester carboxylesterase